MEAGHHLYLQFIQNVALFYHGVDIRVSLDIVSFMKLLLWRRKIYHGYELGQLFTLGTFNNIYNILYLYKLFINRRDSSWRRSSIISTTYTILTNTGKFFYDGCYTL